MSDEPASPTAHRLVALDLLRGLALTIVLVDHIDDLFVRRDFFTLWTMKGLGFSDAAEAFVFLSGFTFGWVYSPRLARDGFWSCQRRTLLRTVWIDAGLILTTLLVAILAWSLSRTSLAFRLPLTVTTPTMFSEALWETATFRDPVWGVAILVVYVCVLPFLPALLWLGQRSIPAALSVTAVVYAGSQLIPALDFSDAGFNPLAWQFLIVAGVLLGQLTRAGRLPARQHRGVVALALLVLIAGLLVMRGTAFGITANTLEWVRSQVSASPMFSKTNLGPARIVHFAAVAVVVAALLRRWPHCATGPWARPFVWSGRYSLGLFCLGVVLAYLAAVVAAFLPEHVLSLLFLAADGVLIQFAAARWLERRADARRNAR